MQITSHGHRLFEAGPPPSAHAQFNPLFGLFALVHITLGVALVAAVVFVAWKAGAYLDAARKKL